jgi:four helix bundle protein
MDAYKASVHLVAAAGRLLPSLAGFDRALESQMKRAAPSVPLNLAEAMRRTGKDRAHLLTVAMGSAAEVQALLDVGLALELFPADQARAADELADRVCAMLYRLRRRSC